MYMGDVWKLRRPGVPSVELRQRFGPLAGHVLWARGFESASDTESRFNARLDSLRSPFTILNMEAATTKVADAITEGRKIVVYGDYDIDGTSGLAVLTTFLRAVGAKDVIAFQPDRLVDGYGVHPAAMENLKARGADLVITVDTGTTAVEAGKTAQRIGLDFIVTDHHQQLGELPPGAIVLNPNQAGDTSGLNMLSGAGMAFYFAAGLRSKLRDMGWFRDDRVAPDLREWLDLVVLGTVADVVPLVEENRALVRVGLQQLAKTKRAGLGALVQRTLSRLGPDEIPSARDVAFALTPKLNAASRMGKAELSTELLLTDDAERAEVLVEEILSLNSQRSSIQAKVFEEALALADEAGDSPVLLVAGNDWHEGVLGIVAAKLVETFHRPAIVITRLPHDPERLRGSMRTVRGMSCLEILGSAKEHLAAFGGHEMAAGLQVLASQVEPLRAKLRNFAPSEATATERTIEFDAEWPSAGWMLNADDVVRMEGLGPWGEANPEPLFLVRGLDVSAVKTLKESHAKTKLPTGPEVIGFFKAAAFAEMAAQGHQKFDALVSPSLNRFRGTATVQFRLEHVRPHQGLNSGT